MPKYIIEREIPNAAALSPAELQAISQRSCAVLRELGPSIQWVQSYVTEDKITCVYIAPNADLIRSHAQARRIPGGSCAGGGDDHRPDDRGVERSRGHRQGIEGRRKSRRRLLGAAAPSSAPEPTGRPIRTWAIVSVRGDTDDLAVVLPWTAVNRTVYVGRAGCLSAPVPDERNSALRSGCQRFSTTGAWSCAIYAVARRSRLRSS